MLTNRYILSPKYISQREIWEQELKGLPYILEAHVTHIRLDCPVGAMATVMMTVQVWRLWSNMAKGGISEHLL